MANKHLKWFLYSGIWLFLCLLSPLFLLKRCLKTPQYRHRWFERFAIHSLTFNQPVILIHAVSVGENIAAKPLIDALLTQHPNHAVLLTCSTLTGSQWIQTHYQTQLSATSNTEQTKVQHCYLPFDAPWLIRRFITQLRPKLVIIMETEVWPSIVQQCHKTQIPLVLANGRMSEKSANSYLKASRFLPLNWAQITHILAQAPQDKQRFHTLGANSVSMAGNIKLDQQRPADLTPFFQQQHAAVANRPVWIAASTHQGEDEICLAAHQSLLTAYPNALLIIVPRHPERFKRVSELCRAQFTTALRSSEALLQQEQVWLLDSIGELNQAYQLASKAFIGGSLSNTGGHNPIEALVAGNALCMGDSRFNFATICQSLNDEGLLAECTTPEQLADWLMAQFNGIEESQKTKSQQWLASQQGSLARQLNYLSSQLTTH